MHQSPLQHSLKLGFDTTANVNSTSRLSDLDEHIYDCNVVTLIDMGADLSVISGTFTGQLKKVKSRPDGPEIRTAGGNLVLPTGRCTPPVTVSGCMYPANFVVPRSSASAMSSWVWIFLEHIEQSSTFDPDASHFPWTKPYSRRQPYRTMPF